MTWFKVDDQLHAHPKALEAGNGALGLWVRAGSWSAQQLTNGYVPASLAKQYGSRRDIRALLDAGLWHTAEGGYRFHDWADFQPTEAEVEDLRQKRSEAGRAGAAKRWNRGNGHSNGHGKPIASAIASDVASDVANQCPDPDPVVSGSVVSHSPAVPRAGTDGLDLDKIAAELGQPPAWARRVAADVLTRTARPPKDRTAYVLAAIRGEPSRYQPTPGPPPVGRICDHGRDKLTCPDCRAASASWA